MSSTHAGKVVIVTGSARSIGAAIASQLASELAKVVVNYNIGEAAEDVVAAILRDGEKALAVQADGSTLAGAEQPLVVAEADLGSVDYLVNNASAILYKALADLTDNGFNSADMQHTWATKGAVEQMSHIFAREMGARNIRINVVSPEPTDTEPFK